MFEDFYTPDERFVAGIHQKDPGHYKDFFESGNLNEAKQQADEVGMSQNKKATVFDRKEGMIVYRFEPDQPAPPPIEEPKKKRKKK